MRDEHNEARDESLAKFVLQVHLAGAAASNVTSNIEKSRGELSIDTMKGYIAYCRRYVNFNHSKCAPRLSEEASEKLLSHYVDIRMQVSRYESEANQRSSVPITVRQLEAIIRITESIAKISLCPVATVAHVDEAIRLFKVSTLAANRCGYSKYHTSHCSEC
jgi:DNA replication licensing factor MCM5